MRCLARLKRFVTHKNTFFIYYLQKNFVTKAFFEDCGKSIVYKKLYLCV